MDTNGTNVLLKGNFSPLEGGLLPDEKLSRCLIYFFVVVKYYFI